MSFVNTGFRKSTMCVFWIFTRHTCFILFNSKIIAWMAQLFFSFLLYLMNSKHIYTSNTATVIRLS